MTFWIARNDVYAQFIAAEAGSCIMQTAGDVTRFCNNSDLIQKFSFLSRLLYTPNETAGIFFFSPLATKSDRNSAVKSDTFLLIA